MEYKYEESKTKGSGRLSRLVEDWGNAWVWWGLAVVGYAGSRATQIWLDASYVRSQFPVPFYVGQTTFDAAELKGYYAHMIEKGTLEVYLHTQRIDYVFMLTAMVSLFLLGAAALRTVPQAWRSGWLGTVGRTLLWVCPLAAGFDAMENAVSFAMLANPTDFADWLVYPYSGFAVAKFALFVTCYLWVLAAIGSRVAYGIFRGWQRLCGARCEVAK